MKEKAKAHNVAHKERFDPPTDEPGDAKPTGTGWVEEHPPKEEDRRRDAD